MKHFFTLQIHRAGIMQSRWLPRIIQTRTQISRELRITSSFGWDAHEDNDAKDDCSQNCIYIMCKTDIFFPGASGRDSAGKFGHQSSSSNWGRGGSTQHTFVPGEAFLVLTYLFVLLVKTVSCLGRINHSKCYPKIPYIFSLQESETFPLLVFLSTLFFLDEYDRNKTPIHVCWKVIMS